MTERFSLRRVVLLILLALVATLAPDCATPTALTVTVYSELGCKEGSAVALVGGGALAELLSKAPSSVSAACEPDGRMGSVVLVPSGAKDAAVAFAMMQRVDGQPADGCLDPAQASGCIVAKRQLRFEPHTQSEMRVDLRRSCLGVSCATEETCVKGTCVAAQTTCGASCDESALLLTAPDGGPAADATTTPGLVGLTISNGTLTPAFSPPTQSYGVIPTVVTLGVPLTVTPILASGASAMINGAAVASGAASGPIAQSLLAPTPIDVAVVPVGGGSPTHYAIVVPPAQEAYVKASNTRASAGFGVSIALWGDTLVVGSPFESSATTGINGHQADTSADHAGAAYVFTRSGARWTQQAYLKASNARAGAEFGVEVALFKDTLAVGSHTESSNATGVNGNQADTSMRGAGAAYVFVRSGATWSQQAYLKASRARADGDFGVAVALFEDTLAVASRDPSGATGIDGNPDDTSAPGAGAVYVFARSGTTWSHKTYIKASNARADGSFGVFGLALSGGTLAVGSYGESSNATGINGDQADTSAGRSGAAYVFVKNGVTWSQQAYIKASNTRAGAFFGAQVAISGDTLAVGALNESSNATGIDGDQANTSATGAGAVYVFRRNGTAWSQQAYVKASNTVANASFAYRLVLTGDTLAVGAVGDPSKAVGINGTMADTSAALAGAVYLYRRSGPTWSQYAYIKASNTRTQAQFGGALGLTEDTLSVGARFESGNALGINGNQSDTSADGAGAVYVLR